MSKTIEASSVPVKCNQCGGSSLVDFNDLDAGYTLCPCVEKEVKAAKVRAAELLCKCGAEAKKGTRPHQRLCPVITVMAGGWN